MVIIIEHCQLTIISNLNFLITLNDNLYQFNHLHPLHLFSTNPSKIYFKTYYLLSNYLYIVLSASQFITKRFFIVCFLLPNKTYL